jgi:hypothetical protein
VTAHALPPTGPFARDDGSADPAATAALARYAVDGDPRPVQRALLGARVLVPVVAAADEVGHTADGLAVERQAHLATVTLTGRDGRRALPVFTSLQSLAAWDAAARPVPVPTPEAARGAYEDGAVALLVDVAGPVPLTLEGPALLALAEARPWLPPADDPDVLAAVGAALAGLPGVTKIDIGPCDDADLRLTLHLPPAPADARPGAQPEREVDLRSRALAQDAAERLAAVDLLRARLERGLDLAVVPG